MFSSRPPPLIPSLSATWRRGRCYRLWKLEQGDPRSLPQQTVLSSQTHSCRLYTLLLRVSPHTAVSSHEETVSARWAPPPHSEASSLISTIHKNKRLAAESLSRPIVSAAWEPDDALLSARRSSLFNLHEGGQATAAGVASASFSRLRSKSVRWHYRLQDKARE